MAKPPHIKPHTLGYDADCLRCRIDHGEVVKRSREKKREAGLCRCGKALRFNLRRCLVCVFGTTDDRLILELRRFRQQLLAEPAPSYIKKARYCDGITRDDLPPHWRALYRASTPATV